MRLYFRPQLGLTLITLALLPGLIWLGVWQLHRREWKLNLIAETEAKLAAAPISLDAALKLGKDAQYRKVALSGRFDHAKEGFVYAIAKGAAVYHVLTPFRTDDGRILIIDRGIIPQDLKDPAKRAAGNATGVVRVVGVWVKSDPPLSPTDPVDLHQRLWFTRDVAWIARTDHLTLAAPVLIEADATPNPGGWPQGGQTVVAFRNEHLNYAITWFGLAVTLLGCYFGAHVAMGRLGRIKE